VEDAPLAAALGTGGRDETVMRSADFYEIASAGAIGTWAVDGDILFNSRHLAFNIFKKIYKSKVFFIMAGFAEPT